MRNECSAKHAVKKVVFLSLSRKCKYLSISSKIDSIKCLQRKLSHFVEREKKN